MNFNKIAAIAATVAASMSATAGTVTVSTDRAAFTAALAGPVTVEDFGPNYYFPITSGILNSSTNEAGIVPGYIRPGVTYSVALAAPMQGNGFNIDAGAYYVGGFLDTVTGLGPLNVSFDSPTSGFGFDTNLLSRDVHVVVNFADGTSQTFDSQASDYTMHFFGFDAVGSAIVSAQIGSPSNGSVYFSIDDFTFDKADVTAVPEPTNAALLLAGVAALVAAKRRRARAQA